MWVLSLTFVSLVCIDIITHNILRLSKQKTFLAIRKLIPSKNIQSLGEHSFNLNISISINNHTAESRMTAPGLKSHAANAHMPYAVPPQWAQFKITKTITKYSPQD